jgi:hypothetical protein
MVVTALGISIRTLPNVPPLEKQHVACTIRALWLGVYSLLQSASIISSSCPVIIQHLASAKTSHVNVIC